jgi:hypothetical protein
VRKVAPTTSRGQLGAVGLGDALGPGAQRVTDGHGEARRPQPIAVAPGPADQELAAIEDDVPHTRGGGLHKARAAAVETLGDEVEGRIETVEDSHDLATTEHGGEMLGALGALEVGTPFALVAGVSTLAYATIDVSWIHDGKPVSAAALKGNFQDVEKRLKAIEGAGASSVAVLGVTTSKVLGSGLGTTMDGPTSGYAGARTQCTAAFQQSPSAHMCVASELVQFMGGGGVMPDTPGAWYATGSRGLAGSASIPAVVDDCNGFSLQGGIVGQIFIKTPTETAFGAGSCDQSYVILCCG